MQASSLVEKRITELCKEKNISYYNLSYRAAIPMSTLMNIIYGKNPTINTINQICVGFDISLKEFFSTDYFEITNQDEDDMINA